MAQEREIEEQPLRFDEEKKESSGSGRFWLFVKILSVLAIVAVAVLYLPIFHLRDITVNGNRFLDSKEICRIAGLSGGEHILSVKKEKIAEALSKDLRIEEAHVEQSFSGGIKITVREREPLAHVVCSYGWLDLDSNGLVIEAYKSERKRPHIVRLSGVKLEDLYIGDTVKESDLKSVLMFLRTINPENRSIIEEINLSDLEHITARTTDKVEIRLGKAERMTEKAKQTESFLGEFDNSRQSVEYIDFQYKSPVIKFKNAK